MNAIDATVDFVVDGEYLRIVYADWQRSVRRWQHWQLPGGIALLVVACAIAPFDWRFAWPFAAFGLWESYLALTHRRRWENAARSLGPFRRAKVTFSESGIRIDGDGYQSHLTWPVFESYTETATGVFLRPRRGICLYFAESLFDSPTTKKAIVEQLIRAGVHANP
jgi:hypothetical protein